MKNLFSKIVLSLSIIAVVSFLFGVIFNVNEENVKQETRMISYESNSVLKQTLSKEFDESRLETNGNDMEIVAKKEFNMSLLDEIDFIGLDNTEKTFNVRYEVTYVDDDSTLFLTVTVEGISDIPLVEKIPGLVTHNIAGDPDVMFVDDGEVFWLSSMTESGIFDEVGWFRKIVKVVEKAVDKVATPVVKAIEPILKPAVRIVSNVSVSLLGSRAADIGAFILNMSKDEEGIYHANFNCWQQYFGYHDFYDSVFDAATSMRRKKFPFDSNGDGKYDRILWAWKGDYLNLGAGAELGVYKKWTYGNDIWIVDKNEAMKMTLKLDYKGKNIINWQPKSKQWWITAFNHDYQNVNRDNLTAEFTVTFNSTIAYNRFMEEWNIKKYEWDKDKTKNNTAIYVF